MDDLISEFLTEASDSLSLLDTQLVTLEQNPEDEKIIDSIFRVMHTIKGTCGFLGLPRLESVAHAGEDVLDNIRSGNIKINADIISAILEAIDCIKGIVASIEETGAEPEGDDSSLVSKLKTIAASEVKENKKSEPELSAVEQEDQNEPGELPAQDSAELQALFDAAPGPGEEIATPAAQTKTEVAQDKIDEKVKQKAVEKGLEETKKDKTAKPSSAMQTIRVKLDILESLMQMAGELVLTRNQLQQINFDCARDEFNLPLQRLSNITTELQENVMKTRMQPIGNAWATFPRMIRDLSLELGKKVELKMVGEDTDLDRQMLEAIKDPLTHMVRNAADHGLDTTQERLAAGKSETGTITLSSYHEGGHVIVKISDDGRGINVDKVKKKAIENGLTTETEAASMSDKQIYQFIFKPGFSTAEKVTSLSGRGVGMDVVVTNIEKIGGTVEVESVPGKGSDFTIKLPLTLAIMPALIVSCKDMRFAIPQISISEIVHGINKGSEGKGVHRKEEFFIETINDTPVLRLRNRLLPLITLSDVLDIKDPDIDEKNKSADDSPMQEIKITSRQDVLSHRKDIRNAYRKYIVVCEVGSSYFGIIVDQVFNTEEIVVKPKSLPIRNLDYYSGCTILGDGSVILILDPNGLMKSLGSATGLVLEDDMSSFESRFKSLIEDDESNFLLFKAGGKAPKAVPLELVSRLEEMDMSKIEWAGDKRVIQYRDKLMRLVTTDDSYSIPDNGEKSVVVFTDEDKMLGLVVEKIIDIISHKIDIRSISGKNGILGSMVFENVTYDLLDISHYFSNVFDDWLANKNLVEEISGSKEQKHKNLLLVDDSPFFRKFMKPILVVADYEVTTTDSAKKALEMLEAGAEFDAVITDIDMPEMNGFEFVKACKENVKLSSIPFIALTSYSSEEINEKDENAGFSGVVSKSDRDKLVETLENILHSSIQGEG